MSSQALHVAATGQILLAMTLVLVVTIACICALRPIATLTGWVDRPSARKRHNGDIPLIGGVSMFLGLSVGVIYCAHVMTTFELTLFSTAATIAIISTIDDRFDLSARLRLLVQIAVVLVMVQMSGTHIHTLGTYFGHDFVLGWLGIPFTVIAVAGLLNAFNMMDGLDGLCGTLGIVSIAFVTTQHGINLHTLLLAVMLGAGLIPYLAFNLGVFGKRHKIFMGDAGSMTLGYIVAWSLIYSSQSVVDSVMPATVLWFVAIPVMDAVTVMLSRVLRGKSPLSPGRGHIHHILQRAGLGPRWSLLVIVSTAIILALMGKLLEHVGPIISLLLFMVMVVTYAIVRIMALKALDEDHPANVTMPQSRVAVQLITSIVDTQLHHPGK